MMSPLVMTWPTVAAAGPIGCTTGVAVGSAGTLYQARPAVALDWLSTSVAVKLQSGENTPGSVLACATASIFSPAVSK